MKWKGHVAILAANIIYGVSFTIAKEVMPEYILPAGFIFCRVLGALLLFWMLHSLNYERVERKDFFLLAVCGFFGVFANQLLFFYGLNLTTPINTGIIITTTPILVLVVSAIVLKTSITAKKVLGIALGISGAASLILLKNNLSVGSETIKGDLLVMLNALSYGIYLVIIMPLMKKYNPLTVIKWIFTFGFIGVFFFGINDFTAVSWSTFPLEIWLSFGFIVIATTFFAYLLNIYGLKKLSPTVVSTYIYFQPLVATIFAIVMGKDVLDSAKIIAAILIFSGVYLVSDARVKKIQ